MKTKAVVVLVAALLCVIGCSDYPDDFTAEQMVIYQFEVDRPTDDGTFDEKHMIVLRWKTSKEGTSEVYFKLPETVEEMYEDSTEVLDHEVRLTNLFASREYTCRIVSRNEDGYYDEWEDVVFHTQPWPAATATPTEI